MKRYVLVCDGSSHNNGGACGIGFVFYDAETGEKLHKESRYIGEGTNVFAEYQAMVAAMTWCIGYMQKELQEHDTASLVVLSDSNLIVSHITGKSKARTKKTAMLLSELQSVRDQLALEVEEIVIEQIPRNFTHEADELASQAMQEHVAEESKQKYPFLIN